MYMYTYIYIYIHVCMYICMYMFLFYLADFLPTCLIGAIRVEGSGNSCRSLQHPADECAWVRSKRRKRYASPRCRATRKHLKTV